jgi:hypothetical protein
LLVSEESEMGADMTQHAAVPPQRRPEELAAGWLTDYHRELLLEGGDPDGFIERLRTMAEGANPGSPTAEAFTILLERMASEDDSVPL